MSEYIIKGTSLTNIADGIRSVDGSSGILTPAQMAARLNAVKSSIDSALSTLAAKEVTVPSGSTVHKLAELIASIQTGGGLPDGIAAMTTGTYTPLGTQSTSATITHGLGKSPDFFIMFTLSPSTGKVSSNYVFSTVYTKGDVIMGGKKGDKNSVATDGACYVGSNGIETISADTIKLNFKLEYVGSTTSKPAYPHYAEEHRWFAGVYAS